MNTCRDVEPLLTPYVDDEAEPQTRTAVDAHLQRCPPCRERVFRERVVREVLQARRECLRACAPDALRATISRRVESTSPQAERARVPEAATAARRAAAGRRFASGLERRASWLPLSLAATLAIAVAGVFFFGLNHPVEALATQLALDHVKCFQFPPGTGAAAADPDNLGRDWERARGWGVRIPGSAADQTLELVALRRCASTGGLTAHMMYRWRGEPLSVYVLNSASGEAGDTEHFVESLGQGAILWERHGRTYAVVTRGEPSELEPVVKYVKLNAW